MSLGGFIKEIADPADVFSGLSGKTGREAAEAARDITNEELLRQFELTQENLRPSLEAAQRTLPGLESQLSPGGFQETLGALSPELADFLSPISVRKAITASGQLARGGISRPGAVSAASEIDPTLFNELLLGAEADLFGNRLSLAGLGEGAGGVLSELGQRTGAGIAQSNIAGQLAGQQATATGQQNALSLIGLGASFLSDERAKENVEEIGSYKGIRIIRWDWRAWVPQSWRGVTFGFSAQDILNKLPQFVTEINGFLSIDKEGLINHLEAA